MKGEYRKTVISSTSLKWIISVHQRHREENEMTSQILGAYVCTTPDQKKNSIRTSPSGPVVKNPPSNADSLGFNPGWEVKLPYDVGQPSLQLEKARTPQQTVLMQQQRPSAARKEKKRVVICKEPRVNKGQVKPYRTYAKARMEFPKWKSWWLINTWRGTHFWQSENKNKSQSGLSYIISYHIISYYITRADMPCGTIFSSCCFYVRVEDVCSSWR